MPLAGFVVRAGDELLTSDAEGWLALDSSTERVVLINHGQQAVDTVIHHGVRQVRSLAGERATHVLTPETAELRAPTGPCFELVTTGPYRYSRNPQYVGTIPAVLGYAIICNSTLALMTAPLLGALFVLVMLAEESWCRENLGAAYEAYASRVPRFFGLCRPRERSAPTRR